jgi:hypothetical protein
VHVDDPKEENLPALQILHTVALFVSDHLPAGHIVHTPEEFKKVPNGIGNVQSETTTNNHYQILIQKKAPTFNLTDDLLIFGELSHVQFTSVCTPTIDLSAGGILTIVLITIKSRNWIVTF